MQNLADSLTVRTPQRYSATTPAAASAAAAAAGIAAGATGGGLGSSSSEELSTFMVYNLRRKVGRIWGEFALITCLLSGWCCLACCTFSKLPDSRLSLSAKDSQMV